MQLSFICTYMPCSWRSVITFDSTAHAWPTVLRWYLAKQTEGGNCTHNVYRPSFHVIHSLLIFYESKRPKYVYPPLMLVERRSPADPGSCVWVEAKPFAMQDICLSQAGPQMTKAPRCYSADSGVQLPFNSRALGSGYVTKPRRLVRYEYNLSKRHPKYICRAERRIVVYGSVST